MADNNAIVNTEPTVVDTENPADELESGASGINPVVNTSPTTSETPSNLVEKGENGKLSPNPAGFGFTKQVTVNTLSSPGSPDTLYLVPQYDGEGRVKEYYKYLALVNEPLRYLEFNLLNLFKSNHKNCKK